MQESMKYTENGIQYHLQIKSGDVGRYVVLPGDPKRSEKIARYFESPCLVADSREFVTYTGTLAGQRVSVCSTGIGGPSTAIAVEELAACGAHTLIRVGTCGGIDLAVRGGDIVVATSAVRQEGTSLHYMPLEFPAVADFDVTDALRQGAASTGASVHTGVVQSKDSFYGQHEPLKSPVGKRLAENWQAYCALGTICSEMESSTLFIVSSALHVRAGAMFMAIANQERKKQGLPNPQDHDLHPMFSCAVETMKALIAEDKKREV